jgi:hypothetical protein
MPKRRQTPSKLQNKKLKYFCEDQGDVKVVAGSKWALLSGNYHKDLGPVASFWRQQRPKSNEIRLFLASLAWLKRDKSTSSRYIIAQWWGFAEPDQPRTQAHITKNRHSTVFLYRSVVKLSERAGVLGVDAGNEASRSGCILPKHPRALAQLSHWSI